MDRRRDRPERRAQGRGSGHLGSEESQHDRARVGGGQDARWPPGDHGRARGRRGVDQRDRRRPAAAGGAGEAGGRQRRDRAARPGYERVTKTLKVEGLRTQTLRLSAEKQTAPPAAAAGTETGGADERARAVPGADLAGAGDGAPPRLQLQRPGEAGAGPVRASLKFVSWGLAAIAAGGARTAFFTTGRSSGNSIGLRHRQRGHAARGAQRRTLVHRRVVRQPGEPLRVGVGAWRGRPDWCGRLGDRRVRSVADRNLGATRRGGDRVHRPLGALDLYARPRGRWRLAGVRAEVLAEPDSLGRGVSDPCRDAHRGWSEFRVSFCLRPSGLLAGIDSSWARSPRVARTETPGRALRARRVQAGRGARPSRARLGRVAAPPSRASVASPPRVPADGCGRGLRRRAAFHGHAASVQPGDRGCRAARVGDPRRPQHQR